MQNKTFHNSEGNVNQMWQVETQRTFHLRNLQTIYKQKEALKQKSQRELVHRDKTLLQFHKNKEHGSMLKNKSFQNKVDYENQILKNKLLMVMGKRRTASSLYTIDRSLNRSWKTTELRRENQKLKERLQSIKRDKKQRQKLDEHKKKSDEYMEMIKKKSDKKKAYLKSLIKKKINDAFPDVN